MIEDRVKKTEEEEAEEYYRRERAERQEILNVAWRLRDYSSKKVFLDGGYIEDHNYCTIVGSLENIAHRIYSRMYLQNQMDYIDIMSLVKIMCYETVMIPPEYCQPGLHKPNVFYPVAIIDERHYMIHFMSGAFTFMDKLATRRQNCKKACIALLAAAPFQQRCLKRWWVQHMVFSTWNQPEWG